MEHDWGIGSIGGRGRGVGREETVVAGWNFANRRQRLRVGVSAMCGGVRRSELWWSTGGAFPRLDAYDMFIQAQRRIERPKTGETGERGGFGCSDRRVGVGSTRSPVVAMKSAQLGSSLLWAGMKNGGVMAWDCDAGRLMSQNIIVVSQNAAVTSIEPSTARCVGSDVRTAPSSN